MKKIIEIPNLIKKNWFKILVGTLLVVLFLKKDMSFSINMQSPELKDSPAKLSPAKLSPAKTSPKKEKQVYTDRNVAQNTPTERLGMLFSGSSSVAPDLKAKLDKVEETVKIAYLKRFAHVAIAERKKFGVPASIILASALLHSTSGKRDFAKSSNNHFALTCDGDWSGLTRTYDGLCYRSYENAWTSFRNHSGYITSGRFSDLKNLSPTDYKGWAKGLERAGFSQSRHLYKDLLTIIEQYNLNQLDTK